MEDAFKKLEKDGHNTVDNLVNWMKELTEEKVRKCFEDVATAQKVEYVKFTEILNKLATEHQKNVNDFIKTLSDEGPKMLDAVMAAAAAFKEALVKK
ncbi:unnamed protein product [Leptidea sinapis]|uniref:Uncharacterized protein n=1 Tax=Leptidea sinapis TaxID=189913 RepID=A0A5E4R311_9NEOP|nr:unnamed protein product [Leptidea sinapis]